MFEILAQEILEQDHHLSLQASSIISQLSQLPEDTDPAENGTGLIDTRGSGRQLQLTIFSSEALKNIRASSKGGKTPSSVALRVALDLVTEGSLQAPKPPSKLLRRAHLPPSRALLEDYLTLLLMRSPDSPSG